MESKKKKQQIKLPGRIYTFLANVFTLYLRVTRKLTLDNSETRDIRGPFVVIANHESLYDFGAVAKCCLPNRVSFVVSSFYFHQPLLRLLFRTCGCISKRQFYPDFPAIRQMMKVIRRGGCVGIFPEGQTCWSGARCEVDPAIGKLIKSLGVPVLNVRVRGNYLTCPKWSDGPVCRGLTEGKSELLLTAEQVASLTPEEIAETVIDALAYNEYDWQREKQISHPKRSVSGLQRYLWRCPDCGAEFTLEADGNRITCSHCGLSFSMDPCGFLRCENPCVPDTPTELLELQSRWLEQNFADGSFLPFTFSCRLLETAWKEIEEEGYRCSGRGEVTVDRTGMTYRGTRDGQDFTYFVNPKVQWNLTHGVSLCSIDIAGDTPEDRDFAFDPDEPQMLMKVIQLWPFIRNSLS